MKIKCRTCHGSKTENYGHYDMHERPCRMCNADGQEDVITCARCDGTKFVTVNEIISQPPRGGQPVMGTRINSRRLACPECHQIGYVSYTSSVYCEHANESPSLCECSYNCSCKLTMCKSRQETAPPRRETCSPCYGKGFHFTFAGHSTCTRCKGFGYIKLGTEIPAPVYLPPLPVNSSNNRFRLDDEDIS